MISKQDVGGCSYFKGIQFRRSLHPRSFDTFADGPFRNILRISRMRLVQFFFRKFRGSIRLYLKQEVEIRTNYETTMIFSMFFRPQKGRNKKKIPFVSNKDCSYKFVFKKNRKFPGLVFIFQFFS